MKYGNPIFGNYRSRRLYAGIWTMIAAGQTVVVHLASRLPFGFAFVDSVVFSVIMACFIIPLWYPVRFNRWEYRPGKFNIAAHVVMACMFVAAWLLTAYALCFLISSGNPEYRNFLNISLWWKTLEGILFYILAVLVYYIYVYVEQLNEKAANEIHLSKLIKDSELNMLKSQINPHFLFNGLNSVNSLIVHHPEQAQKMLIALSDYLRYAVLSTNNMYSRVADEMENITRYLDVEKLRFGEKLMYESEIAPGCLSVEIPSMLLQPLFENAVKHGVYESLETVRIMVKITKTDQYIHIEIRNNYDEESISKKKGSGTGLRNISERLRLLYDISASMNAKAENGVFTVILKIPVSRFSGEK